MQAMCGIPTQLGKGLLRTPLHPQGQGVHPHAPRIVQDACAPAPCTARAHGSHAGPSLPCSRFGAAPAKGRSCPLETQTGGFSTPATLNAGGGMADKPDERTRAIYAHYTADELAALRARAAQTGLTVEEFLRVILGLKP